MKIKYIPQLDAMDCGAAALAMIISYYGKNPDITEIRKMCIPKKNGISLYSISQAAGHLGFRTIGGYISIDDLLNKNILPCIIHWNQEHFVVLYRIKRTIKGKYRFYIADPGKGFLVYEDTDFFPHWVTGKTYGIDNGIALLLEPTEELSISTTNKQQTITRLKFLFKYFKRFSKYFAHVTVGLFIGAILQLIFPFLTQSIVDIGIDGKDIDFIWLVLIAQMIFLFSKTIVEFIRSKILLHISTRINISLISDFFIKLMKLPMKYFDTKLDGDLIQRIEDHKRVEKFLTTSSLNVLYSLFSFVVFGVVLIYYNHMIFTVFLTGTIVYGIWICLFLNKRRKLDYLYFETEGSNRNTTYQLISGMQEIKLQGCEQQKRWEWEDIQADLYKIRLESLNLQQLQQIGSITINELKNIIITVLAATTVIQGDMTLGMMLAIQYILGQLNTPVEQLISFIYSWQDVSIGLERMNEIHMKTEEENSLRSRCEFTNKTDNNSIIINDLSFKYDIYGKENILSNINLNIQRNTVTAIVGASGSGKTTLLKLLLGFYEPLSGNIKIEQSYLDQLNLNWWRSQCGAVMQEGYLFSDTIAKNIAISDEKIDFERVRYAAKVANIADYIESLPLAYNTKIGNDGQSISQGQRQRILIARVIYKNPQFVFLDEATNSLDANNERIITENLNKFYQGKTVIIVAHRLSTVKNADKIVVMDEGRIAEIGKHNELINQKGKYYSLIKNQLELGD